MSRFTAERYIGRQFLVLTLASYLSLLVFFSIFALAEFTRIQSDFFRALRLTGYNLGLLASQVAPLALLLSVFVLGTALSRRGELIALLAVGTSPLRLYLPVLVLSAGFAFGGFIVSDRVAPEASKAIDRVVLGEIGRWNTIELYFHRPRHWFKVGDQFIRIGEINKELNAYFGVELLRIVRGRVVERVTADKVLSQGTDFLGFDVVTERFTWSTEQPIRIERADEKLLPLGGVLNAFYPISSRPQRMTLEELDRVYKLRRRQGYNPALYEAEFYGRALSAPVLLALVLLALTFAFRPEVKRSLVRAALECVGLVGLGFSIQQTCSSLATSRILSAQMGAILPLLILLAAGLWRLASVHGYRIKIPALPLARRLD